EVFVGVAGNAQDEVALDHRLDDRHLLEVGAIRRAWRDAEIAQLLRQVVLRLLPAGSGRRASAELVRRQDLVVIGQRLSRDLIFSRTRRRRWRCGLAAANGQENKGGTRQLAHDAQYI